MAHMSKEQIKATFAKARAAREAGKLVAAEEGFKTLLKKAPPLAEVHFNLAEIFALRGRAPEAAGQFEAALKLRPGEPVIWVSYLNFAASHPNPDNLAKLATRAAQPLKGQGALDFFQGLTLLNQKDARAAAGLFERALGKGFKQPRVYIEHSKALELLGQDAQALDELDAALALQPTNEYALSQRAGLLRNLGRREEAKAAALKAIARNPKLGSHYYTYGSIDKMAADDPMIAQMTKALKTARKGDRSITFLGHALGKAMEDIGEPGRVFAYVKQANDETARLFPWDEEKDAGALAALRDAYDKIEGQPVLAQAPDTAAPIFVTGLPRSGTTLVERILAAHSEVVAGDELGELGKRLLRAAALPKDVAPALAQAGVDYLDAVRARLGQVPCFTDKSINTFAYIGFVPYALPNARIVVVRRHPCDNAWSIYKNLFEDGQHRFSTRLDTIAKYMRLFEAQLDFWRARCPGQFHEIWYEDLVADMEPQARALVGAAGLEWEEGCLEFYKAKTKVRTLSTAQVRQPVYASSVAGWRKYEAEMAPFLDAYGAVPTRG